MAIPRGLTSQRDFSAGQLDATANRRDDTDLFKSGCATALNLELLATGGATRRAGLLLNYQTTQGRIIRAKPRPDWEFDAIFRDGEVEFINNDTGASETLTGCPWSADDLDYLSFAAVERRIFVAAPGMRPQVLAFNSSDAWTRSNFSFRESLDGTSRMPFYRFGNRNVTLTVTGDLVEGSAVTLDFDGDVLEADHVGSIFLYGKSQIEITSVTSPTQAEGTALQTLPRFWAVRLEEQDRAEGFMLGDIVEGDIYHSKGQVVGFDLSVNTLYVLTFDIDGRYQDEETLIGPNASGVITGETVETTGPYATTIWEEQFISEFRGWPGAVAYDRSRLIFYNFDQLPDAFIESAIGDPTDMKVGSTASDAIFERTPTGDSIRHIIGGQDQFVLTDNGIFYIPISTSNPLAPGSVQLVRVGSGGASQTIRPVSTSQGVVYVPADGRRVMAIRQTGQDTRPYELDDIARFHTDLINDPIALATSSVGERGTLETLYVVNADGTMAVGAYTTERNWVGFVPWQTEGLFIDATSDGSTATFMVNRQTDSGPIYTMETLDAGTRIDGAMDLPSTIYADTEVWLVSGDAAYGPLTLTADGELPDDYTDIEGRVGFAFPVRIEPLVENFGPGQSDQQRLHRRKINRWAVTVRRTQEFTINANQSRAGYVLGDDPNEAQPLRSKTFTGATLGRSWDPRLLLAQDWPGNFTVTEIAMEVV